MSVFLAIYVGTSADSPIRVAYNPIPVFLAIYVGTFKYIPIRFYGRRTAFNHPAGTFPRYTDSFPGMVMVPIDETIGPLVNLLPALRESVIVPARGITPR